MTSAEAKLRAATERTAAEFTEAELSPLRLPGTSVGGLRGVGEVGGQRLRRGLAAFGAAAAILAVLAGSLILAGHLRHRAGSSPAGSVASTEVTAADDRTFVLGAERWPTRKNVFTPFYTKLFALRVGLRRSGRVSVHLTAFGLRIPVNWQGDGLALSPDGTMLAFAASPFTAAVISRIWAYSMTTGTVRSWQDPGQIGNEPWDTRSLSWSVDDRTLGYFWETSGNFDLLDTTSVGESLLGHSRKLIGTSSATYPTNDADLTPDGRR